MTTTLKKRTKQKMIVALSGLLISSLLSIQVAANSLQTLSLDALNTNIKWCFDATQNVAEIIEAKNNLSKVTKPCDKILRNKIKPGNVEANALFNRGVIYYHAKQLDNAAQDFTAALHHLPELYQANVALGEIAIMQQKLHKALNYYESVITEYTPHDSAMDKALENKRTWLLAQLQTSSISTNSTNQSKQQRNNKTE